MRSTWDVLQVAAWRQGGPLRAHDSDPATLAPTTTAGHQPQRHKQHQPTSPNNSTPGLGLKKPTALSKTPIHRNHIRQKHMRPAHPRHFARRGQSTTTSPQTPHHPRPRPPPRRTRQQPPNQVSLDPRLLGAYHQTSGATSGIQRALPTHRPKLDGRALTRSRPHQASHPHQPHADHQRRAHPSAS